MIDNIFTLELHGEVETILLMKLIYARLETLGNIHTREATIEFLKLQQIVVRLMPQVDERWREE